MNPIKPSETWRLVELKIEILRQRTEESWSSEQWELAALGERIIRTAEESLTANCEMHQSLDQLQSQLTDSTNFAS
jgi:hypothetical protein